MKPKHVLTLASLAFIVLIGLATGAGAQGPVTTTIGSPAVYDPELRAASLTTIDVPAVFPGGLQAQAAKSPEEQMVDLMNQERASKNLLPLAINSNLTRAAVTHSQDMADHNICGHAGSDGSSPWARIPAAGYTGSLGGEVIACGQTSVQQAFDAWIASPGHRAIIDGQYGEVGLGWITKPGTNYVNFWTADFGGSPGQTTPGSNPGPILTATPIKTPTPFVSQPTATAPFWLWTPTPFYFPATPTPWYVFPTVTPVPQPGGNGYRLIVECNQFMTACTITSIGPR